MCNRCEIPLRYPRCDILLEQGCPRYGRRRVKIIDGGRAIGKAKKEGRNSYGGGCYSFYVKSSKPTGPRYGRAVLQLHPALDLLHHRPVREFVQMHKLRETVHWVLLLG